MGILNRYKNFQLLALDPSLISSTINRLLEAGTLLTNSLALIIMCTCLNDMHFIAQLLATLLKRRPIATYIQKSPNKESVKLLHERITKVLNNHISW